MHELVDGLYPEPEAERYVEAACCVSALLWITGGETVIPLLRGLVDERGDPPEA